LVGGYGGKQSESGGILAILAMLVEDVEKEMADSRADDADAQAKYEKQNGALQEMVVAKGPVSFRPPRKYIYIYMVFYPIYTSIYIYIYI